MKKILFFSLLLFCFSVKAQMVDLMGALGVQGALMNQTTQSVAQGMSMTRRNRILQDLQQAVIEIQTGCLGGYQNVDKNSLSGSVFSGLNWSIGPEGSSGFFIQLNQLDEQTCGYLLNQYTGAVDIDVNHQGKQCTSQNNMHFIFN